MATKLVSMVALAATIVPCLLHVVGILDHDTVKLAALIGTIAWFVVTPMWMGRDLASDG